MWSTQRSGSACRGAPRTRSRCSALMSSTDRRSEPCCLEAYVLTSARRGAWQRLLKAIEEAGTRRLWPIRMRCATSKVADGSIVAGSSSRFSTGRLCSTTRCTTCPRCPRTSSTSKAHVARSAMTSMQLPRRPLGGRSSDGRSSYAYRNSCEHRSMARTDPAEGPFDSSPEGDLSER